jgi:hypothetical protein
VQQSGRLPPCGADPGDLRGNRDRMLPHPSGSIAPTLALLQPSQSAAR